MRSRLWGPVAIVSLAAAWAGCAASEEPFLPSDGAGGFTFSTMNTGGMVSDGGSVGEGGEEPVFPCGQDCSLIPTEDCYVAVCNEGAYPGPVLTCVVIPDENGTPCDDGVFCTIDDTCQAGECTGGEANDCGMDLGPCEIATCDEDDQECGVDPVPNGETCTPDDLCQTGGTCTNGICSGQMEDCFLEPVPNECYNSVCNPMTGTCEPEPGNDGVVCTDMTDLCSVNNTCSGGVCGNGTPKDCSGLTQGCDVGTCDPLTGQCTVIPGMNGQTCDDLDGCTSGEVCTNGTCGGGALNSTCSGATVADGCCPPACDDTNDLDCAVCNYGFDNGTLEGWTVSNTCASGTGWTVHTGQSAAGTHALYYGNPATGDYACGGISNSGQATSTPITLTPGTPSTTFDVWINTEGGTSYDQLGLWIMPANTKVWDRNDFTQGASGNTGGAFVSQTVDLSAYASQTIQLEFRFDTTDSIGNSTEGVYIDSITTDGPCP